MCLWRLKYFYDECSMKRNYHFLSYSALSFSSNPQRSQQSPDILAAVFIYRPSPCTCHMTLFLRGNICVLTVRMECWQIKENALLWRKANAAAQQLKGSEDSGTRALPLNVPFCFSWGMLTICCSTVSPNVMRKQYFLVHKISVR